MEWRYYTLNGHEPVGTNDIMAWGEMLHDIAARTVAKSDAGGLRVSTVFLGQDHNFTDIGPPLLFETMVFGDDDDRMRRYATWDEAQRGHDETVSALSLASPKESK